ncbi:MAG: bifunctional phosphoribosylaminoimidazolecarboxamide formyltransferase/IMP cyclohydrolase [Mycobacterium leprae]
MAVKRALISVYDKTGIVDFARELHALGVELISTGGTYRAIAAAGLPVLEVAQVAGFPEVLDGRVKTLQPQIHAGILAIRNNPEHMAQLREHGITPIDMVVVNLYPFRETVADPNVALEDAVEKIDIGGPSMLRGAAKNWQDVVVLVNPQRYPQVLAELRQSGDVSLTTKFELMVETFEHTSSYDTAIAAWLGHRGRTIVLAQAAGEPIPAGAQTAYPNNVTINLTKIQELRYGENPHQQAAFYADRSEAGGTTIVGAKQLHGKELSFNNIGDANAALQIVKEFDRPAAVAVKHANPCGVAVADTIAEAYRKAYAADPVSIFGGIIALNRPCDLETAKEIKQIFVEIVMAPSFEPDALALLSKKKDVRLLELGPIDRSAPAGADVKRVAGGYLIQSWDVVEEQPEAWQTVTEAACSPALLDDLLLAWKVVKHVKSNAIVVAKNGMTLGVGAGQMNRIDAARHALRQAGEGVRGAVLASDAFFPFGDVAEEAGKAGIAAIVQPGGSIRDEESIQNCNKAGVAMLFTGIRHFRH